jgi:thiamine kinase-like enzyme
MKGKKVVSIFDKLSWEGMINFQQMESNKRNEEALKRLEELSKRLEKALKEDGKNG